MTADKIWKRRDDETSRAYGAFEMYRDMGPGRSLQAVHDAMYGIGAGNIRYVEKWSSRFDWVRRAEAFDTFESERRIQERVEMRERARQALVDKVVRLAEKLAGIALGNVEANKDQVRAIRDALDRAGVTVPQELKVDMRSKVNGRITHNLGELEGSGEYEDKSAAELAAEYFDSIRDPSET